jgi:hypothetical protein
MPLTPTKGYSVEIPAEVSDWVCCQTKLAIRRTGVEMERIFPATAAVLAALVVLGCRAEKQPPARAKESAAEGRSYRFTFNDEPRAIELFRSGIEVQCKAAAEKKARYLGGNGKLAIAMRAEYGGRALPSAEDLRRECIERNRAKKVADDIVFALDVDVDKMHARAAELDASGSDDPGREAEEAWVEAIVASDNRLANASDRTAFCFVAALKYGVFVVPGAMQGMNDNCISGGTPAGDVQTAKFLACIVNAKRRGQVLECATVRDKGREESGVGDLMTGTADDVDSDMSKPNPGRHRAE